MSTPAVILPSILISISGWPAPVMLAGIAGKPWWRREALKSGTSLNWGPNTAVPCKPPSWMSGEKKNRW